MRAPQPLEPYAPPLSVREAIPLLINAPGVQVAQGKARRALAGAEALDQPAGWNVCGTLQR